MRLSEILNEKCKRIYPNKYATKVYLDTRKMKKYDRKSHLRGNVLRVSGANLQTHKSRSLYKPQATDVPHCHYYSR